MSIQSEIDRINGNVSSTYSALSEMGATMPAQQNSDNLPGTVRTVPQGGGTSVQTDYEQNNETALDFLKHRPFYAGFNSVKFDREITLSENSDAELEPIDLKVGQLYSVRYGKNVYTLTGVDLSGIGIDGAVGCGNLTQFAGGGEEYPFAIATMPGMMTQVVDMNGAASTNVSLAIVEGDKIGDTITAENEISAIMSYVLVSNETPTLEDLAKGFQVTYLSGGVEYTKDSTKAQVGDITEGIGITFEHGPAVFIVSNPETGLPPGVYFLDSSRNIDNPDDSMITQSFTIYNSTIFAPKLEMKRMDKKFLPESIVLTSPSGKQFNITVDDSGVLTATEVTE